MPVHHLRMLGRHCTNYNMQDTVLAQLLYHNWIQLTLMLLCHSLLWRWSTISGCWPGVAPTIVQETTLVWILCYLYFDPLTYRLVDRFCLAIVTRRWLNTGSMLTSSSFIIYIDLLPTDISEWPSCETDVVLITANPIETWWPPCMVLTLSEVWALFFSRLIHVAFLMWIISVNC